jgi:DNA-binding transcriptional ArsR family regulator
VSRAEAASEADLDLRFGALADPTRRRILQLLDRRGGGVPAGEIAAEFAEISRPAVSRHLRVLRESGLVRADPRGREILYGLHPQAIEALWTSWFAAFDTIATGALERLRRRAEA